MTDKGESTLRLAMENSASGGSVHCWAEGGDATEDMFEVPARYAAEADRIVKKRMREINEMAARRCGDNGLNEGDKTKMSDGIKRKGPDEFASVAVESGNVFTNGGLHRDGGDFELLVGVEEVPPVLADPPPEMNPKHDDIGDLGLNPVFFGN